MSTGFSWPDRISALNIQALKGFGGGSVVEVVEDWDGNIYRAVYTVRHREVGYVLVSSRRSRSPGRPLQRPIST